MSADRTELHDLAAENPDRVKAMLASYEEWARLTDQAIPGQPRNKKIKTAD